MSIKVLHISIADSQGGAAIATARLNHLMNTHHLLNSKMLVLSKLSLDKEVFEVNYYLSTKARIKNFINNIFNSFKKSHGLISIPFFGNDLSSNKLILESDVIYIHWINNGLLSLNGLRKIAKMNKPIYLFCHDMWHFTGVCHQSNGCTDFQLNCNNCHFFENQFIKSIVEKSFQRKKEIYSEFENINLILPSIDFYRKACKSKIIDNSRVHKISNIIDIEVFKPKKVIIKSKKIKILYGALSAKTNPYKGWNDFLFFAEKITEKYNNQVEFSIFGYDFDESEIKQIKFDFINHGVINEEKKIIKIYQSSDVFFFPSSQESFGQTLIESMSCGLIPLSYNVGVAPDVIINSINGFK